MKKLLLAAALIALAPNAFAGDLASSLDKINSKVVAAQEKVDAAKAKLQAEQEEAVAKVDSLTAEETKAAADAQAEKDAKAAEVAEKVNTLKTNVDNLKNSLTVTK